MIQQKINNMEGVLIIDIDGVETEISAKELDQKTDPKWDKTIDDYKTEIELYKKEYADNPQRYEEKMIEISEDLKKTRKAQNPDYKLWQSYPIVRKPTKHDYKIENDKLVLLTDQERIEKAKEKKKKEIANQLNSLYPERLIDGTMQELYNEKVIEIDALGLNGDLTINEKLAEIKLYSL